MSTTPILFLFSPLGWVDPTTASQEIGSALALGDEASVGASLRVAVEGFRHEKIDLPDFFQAVDTANLGQEGLCRVVAEVDPFQWSLGLHAVDPATLSQIRFASAAEMLQHVRRQLGSKNGHFPHRGKEIISCVLHPKVLESKTTVEWLAAAIKEAKHHFPDIKELRVEFPLHGVQLDNPLSDTWGLVEPLRSDILSEGEEIRITLQLSASAKVVYGFFRGEKGLRKYYYDEVYEKWEILELRFGEQRFGILVHERLDKPGCVEIHMDSHMVPYTRVTLFEIFNQALQTVARRKNLKEVMLIMATARDPNQIDATAGVFIQKSFEDIPGYEGEVTLAAVLPGAIYYYPFKRKLPNRIIRTGSMFFTTLRDFSTPPHLYAPMPELELDDTTLIGDTAMPNTASPRATQRLWKVDIRDLLGLRKRY